MNEFLSDVASVLDGIILACIAATAISGWRSWKGRGRLYPNLGSDPRAWLVGAVVSLALFSYSRIQLPENVDEIEAPFGVTRPEKPYRQLP